MDKFSRHLDNMPFFEVFNLFVINMSAFCCFTSLSESATIYMVFIQYLTLYSGI